MRSDQEGTRASGMGVHWLLLRGLGREQGHWGSFIDRFAQSFPSDQVLCLDLPGAGALRQISCPRSIESLFPIVREQALALASKPSSSSSSSSFRLVALSLGGMIAMEWMRRNPRELAGCVLINTSSCTLSPFYSRLRWQVWGEFVAAVLQQAPRERERALVELLMNREEARHEALPIWTRIASERPMTYRNLLNQLWAASRFRGCDRVPDVPVLLLSSLGDRLVDPSCSEGLHQRWGWPIHRHPWAGHDLSWDDPEWVLEKIRNWNSSIINRA